jgi:hypothetical protein
MRITGKSQRQCYRDIKQMKTPGQKCITAANVSNYYGLSDNEIENALINKKAK